MYQHTMRVINKNVRCRKAISIKAELLHRPTAWRCWLQTGHGPAGGMLHLQLQQVACKVLSWLLECGFNRHQIPYSSAHITSGDHNMPSRRCCITCIMCYADGSCALPDSSQLRLQVKHSACTAAAAGVTVPIDIMS
jgi:hypothetical protein